MKNSFIYCYKAKNHQTPKKFHQRKKIDEKKKLKTFIIYPEKFYKPVLGFGNLKTP